jgi:hypothetical protein
LKTLTVIALIIIAVLLTSAVWYTVTTNLNNPFQPRTTTTPNPTSKPTLTMNPTGSPTLTPEPTFMPLSVANPPVPEFTVALVDLSYDVPVTTTYSTDSYTGQQIVHTNGGYHVTNRTIEITINNQQFTPITLNNGTVIQLYFSLRTKGHFGDWTDTSSTNGYTFLRMVMSPSSATVITLLLDSQDSNFYIPNGGSEDFQVQAQIGYEYPYYGEHIFPLYTAFESLAESDWSGTQIITIPALTPSPTPATSSSTPTVTPRP